MTNTKAQIEESVTNGLGYVVQPDRDALLRKRIRKSDGDWLVWALRASGLHVPLKMSGCRSLGLPVMTKSTPRNSQSALEQKHIRGHNFSRTRRSMQWASQHPITNTPVRLLPRFWREGKFSARSRSRSLSQKAGRLKGRPRPLAHDQ